MVQELWLESETEVSSSSLFTDLVQEPRNSLLFRKTSAVEVFAHCDGKLVLAHPFLTNYVMQRTLDINCIWAFV